MFSRSFSPKERNNSALAALGAGGWGSASGLWDLGPNGPLQLTSVHFNSATCAEHPFLGKHVGEGLGRWWESRVWSPPSALSSMCLSVCLFLSEQTPVRLPPHARPCAWKLGKKEKLEEPHPRPCGLSPRGRERRALTRWAPSVPRGGVGGPRVGLAGGLPPGPVPRHRGS